MPTKERALVSAYKKVLNNPRSHPNLIYKAAEALRELQGLTPQAKPIEEVLPSEALRKLMEGVGDGR